MKHLKKVQTLLIFLFLANTFFAFSQSDKKTKSDPNTPIFEIKNDANQTVFAVYPGGVKIFIDEQQAKASGGGFTVGRISTEKAVGTEFFSVLPNNVRVTIDETASAFKAAGGGFTVGRISTEKAVGDEENLMQITKDNYFIGHNVAPNITTGINNSIFGFQAGNSLTTGHDNVFIGNKAGFNTTGGASFYGNENIYIGNEAGFNSTTPVRNVFIGHEAGHENVTGQYNSYIGNNAGRNGTGQYNTILGGLAGSTNNFGDHNVLIGYVAGSKIQSPENVIIGSGAGYNNIGTEGGNIFIGYYAGETLSEENHRLAIGNDRSKAPLIYGEFDNEQVNLNGGLQVNGELTNPSDKRLKKNITKFTSGLNIINSLNGYYFDWNNIAINDLGFKDKKQVGLIAQEVEKLVPEIVSMSTNGYLAIDYSKMAPILVEAVKEQQSIIEKLENRISNLEKKNEVLKAEVSDVNTIKAELTELKALVNKLVNDRKQEVKITETTR